jgi:hypothetical protein
VAGFLDARMAEKLALTPEQQPRVSTVNLAQARRLQVLAAADDSLRTKARAWQKANDTHEADLRALLSPEQFARFLEIKEQLREALKSGAAAKP